MWTRSCQWDKGEVCLGLLGNLFSLGVNTFDILTSVRMCCLELGQHLLPLRERSWAVWGWLSKRLKAWVSGNVPDSLHQLWDCPLQNFLLSEQQVSLCFKPCSICYFIIAANSISNDTNSPCFLSKCNLHWFFLNPKMKWQTSNVFWTFT